MNKALIGGKKDAVVRIRRGMQQVIVQVIAQLIQGRGNKDVVMRTDLPEKGHDVLRHYVNIIFLVLRQQINGLFANGTGKDLASTNGAISRVQLKQAGVGGQIEAIVHTA